MNHWRKVTAVTASLAAAALLLAGCSAGTSGNAAGDDKSKNIAAPLSGMLGDKSFIDSADAGLKKAQEELGVKVKLIQAGTSDTSAWERNLTSTSSTGNYGLVIAGGVLEQSALEKVAKQFPDQHYLIFDSPSTAKNITGITYAQNEESFLAGALAGYITTRPDLFPRSTGSKKIAFVGGADIPVIRDFAIGYEQGAKSIDPSIQVDISFTNDFSSAQAGYSAASAAYKDGADVVFHAAAAAGLGVLQAGQDLGRYSLGVDSDQNYLHPESVAGSGVKAVGGTIFDAIKQLQDGKLKPGTTIRADLKSGGVSIAVNKKIVPQEIRDKIDALQKQIIDGTITVKTTLK